MANITLNGKPGANYMASRPKDITPSPSAVSLLVDIEDGRARPKLRPRVSFAEIARAGRYPFNAWRGIVYLLLFPQVLLDHCLDLEGRFPAGTCHPCLYTPVGGPVIGERFDDADPQYGAPSAGRVLLPNGEFKF
jgi:hypothetical protein